MDTWIIEAIGFLASAISFTIFLPQALRTWRVRNDPIALAGISTGTQLLILANATLWGVYAVLTGAFWVGAPGLLNAPLAAFTIFLIYRSRGSAVAVVPEGCKLCIDDIKHEIFITAPPGWGSVMPCSEATRPHGVVVMDELAVRALRAQRH